MSPEKPSRVASLTSAPRCNSALALAAWPPAGARSQEWPAMHRERPAPGCPRHAPPWQFGHYKRVAARRRARQRHRATRVARGDFRAAVEQLAHHVHVERAAKKMSNGRTRTIVFTSTKSCGRMHGLPRKSRHRAHTRAIQRTPALSSAHARRGAPLRHRAPGSAPRPARATP